jgi:hypothetical protein
VDTKFPEEKIRAGIAKWRNAPNSSEFLWNFAKMFTKFRGAYNFSGVGNNILIIPPVFGKCF